MAQDAPQVKAEPAAESGSDGDVVESQRVSLLEAKPKCFAKAKPRPRQRAEEAARRGLAAPTLSSEQLMSMARGGRGRVRAQDYPLDVLAALERWKRIRMVIPQTQFYVIAVGLDSICWRHRYKYYFPLNDMSEVMGHIEPWGLPIGA